MRTQYAYGSGGFAVPTVREDRASAELRHRTRSYTIGVLHESALGPVMNVSKAALCAHGLVVPETSVGGTQWHRLSAADTCLLVPSGLQSNGRDLLLCAAQTICVIVDSKVVVHRRRRHQAGVRRRRT